MKTLVLLVLLGVVATVISEKRDKRWFFPQRCRSDWDCGVDRCCVNVARICAPKRGLNQSCNLSLLHGCGCKDGLSCQVYKQLGPLKYKRCLAEPGSGDGF